MNTQQGHAGTSGALSASVMLAQLLDQLDARPRAADPAQYQALAQRLAQTMAQLDGSMLEPLLQQSPSAALIYENIHYGHAGLCRSSLVGSLNAELQAKQAIERAATLSGQAPSPSRHSAR